MDGLRVERWERDADGGISGDVIWSGAPTMRFHIVLTGDGGLVELRVRASPGDVVRVRQVREAPVGAMERVVRSAASAGSRQAVRPYRTPRLDAVDMSVEGTIDPERERMRWRAWAADFVLRPRTGTGGRSDRPYAALAACYVAAFERGEASPVKAVAAELGFGETAVRNYLTKARERGLLTPAGLGRSGGQLTDKAREVMRGDPPRE